MEVLFTAKVKRSKEPFSQQPWPNSIHEMSWFMPLPPWIVHRSVSCSCRNSYGDGCEESGDESKNNSIYLNKKVTFHKISMLRKETCSGSIHHLAHISIPNCFSRLFAQVIGEGRQFDHSSENSETIGI